MYQNVTLKLDKQLLHRAKIFAIHQKKSLSGLMLYALQSLMDQAGGYAKSKKKALGRLKKGFQLGGGPYFSSRQDLHQR